MLSKEELNELFDYYPKSGKLIWKEKSPTSRANKIFNSKFAFQEAGRITESGYLRVQIKNRDYYVHRIIWVMTQEEPLTFIDHINGIKHDNRLANLRLATYAENLQNRNKPKSNNSTGVLGVSKKGTKFIAHICVNYKLKSLGSFNTIEEASNAYQKAKKELHTFNRR